MKIERAVFVDGAFRGVYTLEGCDTYTLPTYPEIEHCIQCDSKTKFHWRKKWWVDYLNHQDRDVFISNMIRLDVTRPITEFIPFEQEDISGD